MNPQYLPQACCYLVGMQWWWEQPAITYFDDTILSPSHPDYPLLALSSRFATALSLIILLMCATHFELWPFTCVPMYSPYRSLLTHSHKYVVSERQAIDLSLDHSESKQPTCIGWADAWVTLRLTMDLTHPVLQHSQPSLSTTTSTTSSTSMKGEGRGPAEEPSILLPQSIDLAGYLCDPKSYPSLQRKHLRRTLQNAVAEDITNRYSKWVKKGKALGKHGTESNTTNINEDKRVVTIGWEPWREEDEGYIRIQQEAVNAIQSLAGINDESNPTGNGDITDDDADVDTAGQGVRQRGEEEGMRKRQRIQGRPRKGSVCREKESLGLRKGSDNAMDMRHYSNLGGLSLEGEGTKGFSSGNTMTAEHILHIIQNSNYELSDEPFTSSPHSSSPHSSDIFNDDLSPPIQGVSHRLLLEKRPYLYCFTSLDRLPQWTFADRGVNLEICVTIKPDGLSFPSSTHLLDHKHLTSPSSLSSSARHVPIACVPWRWTKHREYLRQIQWSHGNYSALQSRSHEQVYPLTVMPNTSAIPSRNFSPSLALLGLTAVRLGVPVTYNPSTTSNGDILLSYAGRSLRLSTSSHSTPSYSSLSSSSTTSHDDLTLVAGAFIPVPTPFSLNPLTSPSKAPSSFTGSILAIVIRGTFVTYIDVTQPHSPTPILPSISLQTAIVESYYKHMTSLTAPSSPFSQSSSSKVSSPLSLPPLFTCLILSFHNGIPYHLNNSSTAADIITSTSSLTTILSILSSHHSVRHLHECLLQPLLISFFPESQAAHPLAPFVTPLNSIN